MEELNKKLAEWAGFREYLPFGHSEVLKPWIHRPDGETIFRLPRFTKSLDACFKWLVPQALEMIIGKGYVPPIVKLFQLWYDELVSLTGDSSNVQQVALALCKAIEKLIDGEK